MKEYLRKKAHTHTHVNKKQQVIFFTFERMPIYFIKHQSLPPLVSYVSLSHTYSDDFILFIFLLSHKEN